MIKIKLFVIGLFLICILQSCISNNLSSNEIDDVYFTKKDIVKKDKPFEEEYIPEIVK